MKFEQPLEVHLVVLANTLFFLTSEDSGGQT